MTIRVDRRVLLVTLSLLAEGIWLWAGLALFSDGVTGGRFPVWSCMAFYAGSAAAYLALQRWRLRPRVEIALRVSLYCGALVLFTVLTGWTTNDYGITMWGLVLAASLGWRGWVLASDTQAYGAVLHRFQAGALTLLGTVAVAYMADLVLPFGVPLVAAFFFVSLLALAMARSGRAPDSAWVGISLGTAGAVFVLGLLITLAVTPGMVDLLLAPLRWLWGGVQSVGTQVAEMLPTPHPDDPGIIAQQVPTPMMDIEPRQLSPLAIQIITYVAIILGGGLVLASMVALVRELRRWIRRRRPTEAMEMERLQVTLALNWRRWPGALLALARRVLARIQRRFLGPPDGDAVQRHYRMLQRWARRRGVPRSQDETPLEYLARLTGAWPMHRSAFERITHAYVQARYSPRPPDDAALAGAVAGWKQLRRARRGRKAHPVESSGEERR